MRLLHRQSRMLKKLRKGKLRREKHSGNSNCSRQLLCSSHSKPSAGRKMKLSRNKSPW